MGSAMSCKMHYVDFVMQDVTCERAHDGCICADSVAQGCPQLDGQAAV